VIVIVKELVDTAAHDHSGQEQGDEEEQRPATRALGGGGGSISTGRAAGSGTRSGRLFSPSSGEAARGGDHRGSSPGPARAALDLNA